MEAQIAAAFPHLRAAQQKGLTLWVFGAIRAGSACVNAVQTRWVLLGATWDTMRDALREWLLDGAAKAAPCQTQVEIDRCFAPLLGWVLRWWQGSDLPLAIDATSHGDRVVALVISVLYRGNAIPVAWQSLPANRQGAWMPVIRRLLGTLQPVVPKGMRVLVLTDRGLWSPKLWRALRWLKWHPLRRLQAHSTVTPVGQARRPARQLVPGPGHAWVGVGTAFKPGKRQRGTVLVVWGDGEAEPWVLLTDLAPERVGLSWYGLRPWIELGFRALKGVGFQWQQTRRTEPDRVARHWLGLAVAMLWSLAAGTRVADALALRLPPAQLVAPPPGPVARRRRHASVVQLGLGALQDQVRCGPLWCHLWLGPDPWPEPPPGLQITYHHGEPLSAA
jgi:hypothetical protein